MGRVRAATPDASFFHLFGWRNAIYKTYGHATYYLMLTARDDGQVARAEQQFPT